MKTGQTLGGFAVIIPLINIYIYIYKLSRSNIISKKPPKFCLTISSSNPAQRLRLSQSKKERQLILTIK